jgi:hypothetical protein
LFENGSAFVHGCAGCKNIINENNAPVRHCFGLLERKRACHIPYPLHFCRSTCGLVASLQGCRRRTGYGAFCDPVREKRAY